jgi:hypothetical protein
MSSEKMFDETAGNGNDDGEEDLKFEELKPLSKVDEERRGEGLGMESEGMSSNNGEVDDDDEDIERLDDIVVVRIGFGGRGLSRSKKGEEERPP